MAFGKSIRKTPLCGSARLALAIVGFLGSVNLYALRIDMSVAIVCMVNHTALRLSENVSSTNATAIPRCGVAPKSNSSLSEEDGPFVWDKDEQGSILGVFFWGYLVSQIPASILVQRIGARWTIFSFMAASTIATLLLPIATTTIGPVATKLLRFVMGMGSGVWFPAFHTMWSIWAPPLERSLLAGITYAGSQIGNVITLPIAGLLCKYGFAGGWPSVFYVFGIASVLWLAAWAFFAFDSPASHPRIDLSEKEYIENALSEKPDDSNHNGDADGNNVELRNADTEESDENALPCEPARTPTAKKYSAAESNANAPESSALVDSENADASRVVNTTLNDDVVVIRCCTKPVRVHTSTSFSLGRKRVAFDFPFVAVLCSMPVWSTWVANITYDFGIYLFLTTIPTYMKEVLGFEITGNGLVSALPFVLFWAVITASGYLADLLIHRKLLSVTATRKLMTCFGMLVPAALIVLLSFVDCQSTALAVAILAVGVATSGTAWSGFVVNHMDIAPRYAGILFAIGNSFAAATGYFAPLVVAVFTKGVTDSDLLVAAWRNVFIICAAIYTFGAIFYLIFASGELQPWCVPKKSKPQSQKTQNAENA